MQTAHILSLAEAVTLRLSQSLVLTASWPHWSLIRELEWRVVNWLQADALIARNPFVCGYLKYDNEGRVQAPRNRDTTDSDHAEADTCLSVEHTLIRRSDSDHIFSSQFASEAESMLQALAEKVGYSLDEPGKYHFGHLYEVLCHHPAEKVVMIHDSSGLAAVRALLDQYRAGGNWTRSTANYVH